MNLRFLPLAALVLAAGCSGGEKPEAELSQARAAIVEAQAADADRVAPEQLTSAQDKLARAQLLADEGEEDDARLLAQEARADANAALASATEARAQGAEIELAATQARLEELEAQETERGYVVTLGDVLFETDSATLTPAGLQRVARIASYMQANPGEAVVIEGHADATGDASYNQTLSEQRAEAVATALLTNGVPTPRIVYTGLGESSPIASNATSAGRQLNRRVEVIFVDV